MVDGVARMRALLIEDKDIIFISIRQAQFRTELNNFI